MLSNREDVIGVTWRSLIVAVVEGDQFSDGDDLISLSQE
jgi:hypothetical protein